MQWPRIVFLFASLSVMTAILFGFTCYHGYLLLTNQTTNERYKRHALRGTHKGPQSNLYNRGWIGNISEDLFHYFYATSKTSRTKAKNNIKTD